MLHSRCQTALRLIVLAILVTPSLGAADSTEGSSNEELLERSAEMLNDPEAHLDAETAERLEERRKKGLDEQAKEIGRDIRDQSIEQADEARQQMDFGEEAWASPDIDTESARQPMAGAAEKAEQGAAYEDIDTIVFLSFSMSDAELRSAFRRIDGDPNAVALFKGLKDADKTFNHTIQAIAELLQDEDLFEGQPPNISIDPEPFVEYDVGVAPTIVRRSKNDDSYSLARGIANPNWIREEFDQDNLGDLGTHGSVHEIAEMNLIELMKERASQIDGDKKIEQAKDRFWDNYPMYEDLPTVRETGSRHVDMTIRVEEDIRTPDGAVIAEKGDEINPLSMVPFRRIGIIFDPTDEDQLRWAQEVKKEAYESNNVPVLMASRVDREAGWDGYRELNRELFPNRPVYMLQRDIVERFGIQRVPTRFEREGMYIRVTEVSMEEWVQEHE